MRCSASILISAALLFLLPVAGAAELPRVDVQGATGMCKAATFAFSQDTRYRPLALVNESNGNLFATCNWQGDDRGNSERGAKRLSVTVGNEGTVARNVTCTLVNGHQTGGLEFAVYVPRTVSVPAGGNAEISWVPADVSNAKPSGIDRPSLSCQLPTRTSLQHTRREYNENVGA